MGGAALQTLANWLEGELRLRRPPLARFRQVVSALFRYDYYSHDPLESMTGQDD